MNNDLISLYSLLGGSKTSDLKNEELPVLTDFLINTKTNDLYTRHISDDKYHNMTENVKDSKGNYIQPIFIHDCHNGKKLILSVQIVDAKKSESSENNILEKIKHYYLLRRNHHARK